MSYVLKSIVEWLTAIITDLLKGVVSLIATISAPHPYWTDPWAINSRGVVVAAAWALLTLKIAYESWRLYIARDAGEAIMPPGLLIRRAIMAGVAIPATGWAVDYLVQLAQAVTNAIAATGVTPDLYAWGVSLVSALTTTAVGLGFGTLLLYASMIGILVVMMLLIFLQGYVRGVEIAIGYIVGPVCAISAGGNDEPLAAGALGMWFKEMLVLTLTQAVQMALMMGVVAYTLGAGFEIVNVLLSIPIVYVALKIPTILRNYVYSSGGGASSGGHHHVIMLVGKALAKAPW